MSTKAAAAYALRVQGFQLDEIAKQLSLSLEDTQQCLLDEGERRAYNHAEALRISTALEIDRLDSMFKGLTAGMVSGDLPTIDRALKIMERRAKLLGLDQPEMRAQLTIQTQDTTDLGKLSAEEIRTLLQLQAKMTASPDAITVQPAQLPSKKR